MDKKRCKVQKKQTLNTEKDIFYFVAKTMEAEY